MKIKIYGHPFASFAWKAFIAAYERGVPFELCMVDPDHPGNSARIADLSPTGQFPALVDGDRHVTQSNSVIEYLDRFGDAAPMIPDDHDAALDARMLAYIFDSYVSVPVQQIVGEALRPKEQQDQGRVTEAKAKLDKSYAWLSSRIGDNRQCRRLRSQVRAIREEVSLARAIEAVQLRVPCAHGELSVLV